MKKILVCEDEAAIRDFVVINLTRAGYDVVEADCGEAALQKYEENNGDFDVAILDVMMPGIDGFQVCKELRNRDGGIGIIMLSAKTQEMDKVTGLMLGADDYVTKPFHNEELLARIAVRLRSGTDNPEEKKLLAYKDIELDTENFTAVCNGKQIEFSKHEFALLSMLMENLSRTCTKSMIYDKVWDYENSADDNTLNVHISRIRRKLKECNPEQEYIETVWGIGYRLMK